MTDERPDGFEDLAGRARDRARRDADAITDVETALSQVRSGTSPASLSGSGSGASGTTWVDRRRWWLASAAAVLVTVVAVSVVAWLARESDEQLTTVPVTDPPVATSPLDDATVPPTSPPGTTSPLATTTPTTTDPGESHPEHDPCVSEAAAPPALIDGSDPGEGTLVETEDGRRVVWGDGSFHAVTQGLDMDIDPDHHAAAPGVEAGEHEGRVMPVGDPPLGQISLYWTDSEGCVRAYWIGSGFMVDEARDYLERWLTSVDTGEEFDTGFQPAFDAPTEYAALRLVEGQFDDVRRIAPDGTDLGPHPAVDDPTSLPGGRLPDGARLTDGRRLTPARYDSDAVRCVNDDVTLDGEILHPDLDAARAIDTTPDGLVIAGRDVCPDGARWGDPGTRWELVRLDLRDADPQVEVMLTRDPDPDLVTADDQLGIRARGAAGVSAISVDERLVALADHHGGERPEWTIRALDPADTVIDPPSACPSPGPIVAAPVFVTDNVAVVGRSCPDGVSERFLVETIELGTAGAGLVVHSVEIADLATLSEFRYIVLSAIADGDDTWAIASIADLERSTTATLVRNDTATDIAQPGYRSYAFIPDDLTRR